MSGADDSTEFRRAGGMCGTGWFAIASRSPMRWIQERRRWAATPREDHMLANMLVGMSGAHGRCGA